MNDLTVVEPGRSITDFDPELFKGHVSKVNSVAQFAIAVKDETMIAAAAKAKADAITKLSVWWEENVAKEGIGSTRKGMANDIRIEAALLADPKSYQKDIAAQVGVDPSTLVRHHQRMRQPARQELVKAIEKTISQKEAENLVGFSHQTVSRWRRLVAAGEFEIVLRDMWLRAARIIPPKPKEPDTSLCWTDPEKFADYVIDGLEKFYPRELIPAARDCAIERLQGYVVTVYEDEEEDENEHEAAQATLEWLAPTDE